MVGLQAQGQVAVEHRLAIAVVDQEQRRPVSPVADQHQGVPVSCAGYEAGQFSMVGASISEVRRQFLAEPSLDLGEQVDGQERRPAQVEKVVLDSHRLEPQQVGPDLGQGRFDLVARRDERAGPARGGIAGDPARRGSPRGPARAEESSVAIRSNRCDLPVRLGATGWPRRLGAAAAGFRPQATAPGL